MKWIACLAALVMVALAVAAPVSLYVAGSGDDSWSGALSAPNADRTDGPLATLHAARDKLRALKATAGLPEGARVLVRAGTYSLAETLLLGPEDSGCEGGEIIYSAYPGETVSLLGSRILHGWRPDAGGVYRAHVPDEALAVDRFWQLYYGGKRQTLARSPNVDPQHPRSGGFAYAAGVVEPESKTLLQYKPERLDPSMWSRPQEARVHIWSWLNWNRSILPIAQIDLEGHVITLGKPASYKLIEGNRFFVENVREELDAPGEWYLDVEGRVMYFLPPEGRRPGREVSVPVVSTLIEMNGDAKTGRFVEHIRISGFTMAETRATLVQMTAAAHCTLAACTLTNCGSTAVCMRSGSHHNRIAGCDITHVGGTAILLDDVRDWTHQPEGHLAYNVIDNNHVADVGEGGDAWGAIRLSPSCGGNASHHNVISHNLVHDTPRQGISFNGMGNVVEYNHVHHTNQEQSDTGAIGMGSRDIYERGSSVRYNYVHDTGGYNMLKPGVWEYPHYCWGVYLDDYTSGVHVYGNLIVNTYRGGVMVHGGQDNVIENNVIIDGHAQQVQYSPIDSLTSGRTVGHPDTDMWLMTGNRCIGNIFAYSEPKAGWAAGKKWEQILAESDRNVVWHDGSPVTMNMPGVTDDDYWGAWQKLGFDAHSVIADPQFVDPERGDYRLRPTSPALALGFKQLPFEQMGLYESPERASWPVEDGQLREEHLRYPEGEPTPAARAVRTDVPVLKATRRAAPPAIDGRVDAPEWDWTSPDLATVAELSLSSGGSKQPSRLLISYDDEALYVALVNQVSDSAALLAEGGTWGADDGAEVCVQDVSGSKPGPVWIVQGYPSGKHECKPDAGAPAAGLVKLTDAIDYAATIGDGRWTGEWRIPFAAMGIDPSKTATLLLNVGVLKKTESQWIAWVSTGGAPWHMERAGKLLLVR